MGLANDLEAAWNAPRTTMRTRQQLLRSLVTDIVADVDENHQRGGFGDPLAGRPTLAIAGQKTRIWRAQPAYPGRGPSR